MVLVGRWWKFTYDQIRDNSRTKAQCAKTFEKGFLGFGKKNPFNPSYPWSKKIFPHIFAIKN